MSALTKVFVVLVTLLAITLTALIIPFVSNVEEYRRQRDESRQAKAAAEESAAIAASQVSVLQEQESQRMTELKAEKALLVRDINQLKNQLGGVEARLAEESASKSKLEADLSRLTSSNQQYAQLISKLEGEVQDLRGKTVEQERQNIQLADANTELESQVQILNTQVRVQRETIQELEDRTVELATTLNAIPQDVRDRAMGREPDGGTAGTPGQPVEYQDGLLTGKVNLVERLDDQTFAQIDLGEVDGVRPNMLFRVHRGNQFLGKLIINAVDERAAAGRIELSQGIEIQPGDRVQSGGLNR